MEFDVIAETPVLSPSETHFIVSQGHEMKERLESFFMTSPTKLALVGAGLGVFYALSGEKNVPRGEIAYASAMGAVLGALTASVLRRYVVIGYGCGLCKGMQFCEH